MKEFDFVEFYKNVQKDFVEIDTVINNIESNRLSNYPSGEVDDLHRENLEWILEKIYLKIKFAYNLLGLKSMCKDFIKELKKYEGKFHQIDSHHIIDVTYSPVKDLFFKHISAITAHVKIEEKEENQNTQNTKLLERILRGTAKILTDNKIEPQNEAEVRREIYKMLIHVFPDTVREIPIAKVSKSYKPDIGIKSLKCAVEYKFVDSLQEAKTAIGGVFEDIKGYEGSEDWRTFYAVIYMTDNFMTQDQVEAEFKLSKVPHNWKPFVVYGKGKRKGKSNSKH